MAKIKFSINKKTLLEGEREGIYLSRVPNSGRKLYTAMSKDNLINMDETTLYFEFPDDYKLPIWDEKPGVNDAVDFIKNQKENTNSVSMPAKELYDGWYEFKEFSNPELAMAAQRERSQKQNDIIDRIEQTRRKPHQQESKTQQSKEPQQNTAEAQSQVSQKQETNAKQVEAPKTEVPRQKELTELEKWENYRASIKHYSKDQFREIRKGIRQHLDVKQYQNINLSAKQMRELRLALRSNIDVSSWNSPYVSVDKMKELRLGAKHGIRFDMNKIDHRLYNAAQLKELRLGFEKDLSVKEFLNPAYSAQQMHEIRLGLQMGLDIDQYSDIRFSLEQMKSIRQGLVMDNIRDILMRMWERLQEVLSNVLDMVIEKTQANYMHREFRTPEQIKAARMKDAIAEIKYTLVESEILSEDAIDDQEIEFKIREQIKDLVNYMENHPEENIEVVAQGTSNNIYEEITEKDNIQNNIPSLEKIDQAIDNVMDNQISQEEVIEIETWEMQM